MITEDYVSFEIAKLLKEKGFDEKCLMAYIDGELFNYYDSDFPSEYELENDGSEVIDAPTLQMAMKWLRKAHNIHIAIVPCEVGPGVMDYTYILYKIDTENFIFKNLEIQGRANTDKMSAPKTCEAAIKYCLENLI